MNITIKIFQSLQRSFASTKRIEVVRDGIPMIELSDKQQAIKSGLFGLMLSLFSVGVLASGAGPSQPSFQSTPSLLEEGSSYTFKADLNESCNHKVALKGDGGCSFGWTYAQKTGSQTATASGSATATYAQCTLTAGGYDGDGSGDGCGYWPSDSQARNGSPITRNIPVRRYNSWNSTADSWMGDASYTRTLSVQYTDGHSSTVYSVNGTVGPCSIDSNGTVTNNYPGTCKIKLTDSRSAARNTEWTIRANYTYSGIPSVNEVGDPAYSVGVTVRNASADISPQPSKSYSSESASVCTITPAGSVTNVSLGECKLKATLNGNANYVARTSWWIGALEGTTHNMPVVSGVIYTSETPSNCLTTTDGNVTHYNEGVCTIRATNTNSGNSVTTTSWGVYADTDRDSVGDGKDNCPLVANNNQLDLDTDGTGDVCDEDRDGDTVANDDDNCPDTANATQEESIIPGIGVACYTPGGDQDSDGFVDEDDYCPFVSSTENLDMDGDGQGDVCDANIDGDSVDNDEDNCPNTPNDSQDDSNQDGVGDACERRYVKLTGDDANACTSWDNACKTIQGAINNAKAAGLRQVFIKEGVYRPASTINLEAGISLFGGFAGTELKVSEANAAVNLTIISGDSGDDTADADGIVNPIDTANNGNNLSTLMSAAAQGTDRVDKITLQGLVLNAANNTSSDGGALDVNGSYVRLQGTRLVGNAAVNGGGAVVRTAGILELSSSDLVANKASTSGGAIYITGNGSKLVSESATGSENNAAKGGVIALVNSASAELEGLEMQLNTATNGAVIAVDSAADLVLTKSKFILNDATSSAGVLLAEGTAAVEVSDSTFTDNSAGTSAGVMLLANTGTTNVMRNFIKGNTADSAGAVDITAGTKNINNNTFHANAAEAGSGGAIRVQGGTANLDYLTLAANTATVNGGAIINTSGTVNLSRSLTAGNTAAGTPLSGANIYGAIVDQGYNIVGLNDEGGLAGGAALSATGSKVPTAAEADELVDLIETTPSHTGGDGYYSSVMTLAVAGGGIARDAIPEASCGLDYDTRGELRPDKKSLKCDIGAYEFTILDCTEDAQRRYDQGELFVKLCVPNLESFELNIGSLSNYMLLMLLTVFGYRIRKAVV